MSIVKRDKQDLCRMAGHTFMVENQCCSILQDKFKPLLYGFIDPVLLIIDGFLWKNVLP